MMKKIYWPYFFIPLLGFLVYAQTLTFGFTYLDDQELIIGSNAFLSNLGNFAQAFREDAFHLQAGADAYYRPLLTVSFMLDAQYGGIAPFAYHLTNILIHILAASLVFLLLLKLKYPKDKALFFSLIFTLHPALAQAVAWIPGRNDSLLAVFVLLSFIFFLDFLEKKRWLSFIVHLFFLLMATLTKETGMLLMPFCFIWFCVMSKEKWITMRKVILLAGWLLVGGAWFWLRQMAFASPLRTSVFDMGWGLAGNLPVLIQFWGKFFLPLNLSVLPIIRDTSFIYGILSILAVFFLLMISRGKRLSMVFLGLVWFFIFILPTLFYHNPTLAFGTDYHLEHRLYLPAIGLIILLLEMDFSKNISFKNKKGLLAAILVLVILFIINIHHSRNFVDRLAFWKNAAYHSTHSPLAHRNLGAMYYLDGQIDKAEPEYKKALALNSFEPMAHNNLGLIYAQKGRLKEAEEEYKKELAINPTYDSAYFNLGLLYARTGRLKDAELCWRKTIELNPEYYDACVNLAIISYNKGNKGQAKKYIEVLIEKGIPIRPELLNILKN